MKKIIMFITMILAVVPLMISPIMVLAIDDDNKTLQDHIDALEAKKAALERANNDKSLTEDKIKSIKNNLIKLANDVEQNKKNIEKLKTDIIKLNKDIEEKENEIKLVVSQYQLSNGGNAYLEYVFGASTVTDFIYRVAIVEQITTYNNKMIDEMNTLITESNNKAKELEQENKTIAENSENLRNEQIKLGDRYDELNTHSISLKEEINDAIKTIENYKKIFNCKPSDKIKDCTSVVNSKSFIRPIDNGYVSNEYGWGVPGIYSQHSGIDVGGNPTGKELYAAANGNVVYIKKLDIPYLRSILRDGECKYVEGKTNYNPNCSCGGNYVIIQHMVNGESYATRYLHMSQINVKVGDKVTPATQIGTVGGGEFYERCSTAPHMHLDVASGIYASSFYSFLYADKAVINPREVINFPAYGVRFNSRY